MPHHSVLDICIVWLDWPVTCLSWKSPSLHNQWNSLENYIQIWCLTCVHWIVLWKNLFWFFGQKSNLWTQTGVEQDEHTALTYLLWLSFTHLPVLVNLLTYHCISHIFQFTLANYSKKKTKSLSRFHGAVLG